jgi:two-component system, cell cycle response regulator DivK
MARVLVADDDPVNLRVATAALQAGGHEPLLAHNGTECLELAQDRAPDLLLLDVHMPDIDGFEVLRRLREDPRTATLKVVAFTAFAMKGDAERLLRLGFDAYISKPIRYREFLSRLEELLAG